MEEICCKMGISQTAFYAWHKKFRGAWRGRASPTGCMEKENRKLKQLVTDPSLDKAMLQYV